MPCSRCGQHHSIPSERDYLHNGERMVEVVAVSPAGSSALLRDCVTEVEFHLGTCILAKRFEMVREQVAA